MKKPSTINRRIIKDYLRQWQRGGTITMAEACRLMRSEGNVKGTAHCMGCTASTNIRRYWIDLPLVG